MSFPGKRLCENCRWFEPRSDGSYGRCRARAPIALHGATWNLIDAVRTADEEDTDCETFWPIVEAEDWCGEFVANNTRVRVQKRTT